MNIIKKILAIILIFVSIIFVLGFLLQIPKILNAFSSDGTGYGFGYIIGSLLFLVIAYFFFKLGLKLIKNKSKRIETIDQIGKT